MITVIIRPARQTPPAAALVLRSSRGDAPAGLRKRRRKISAFYAAFSGVFRKRRKEGTGGKHYEKNAP